MENINSKSREFYIGTSTRFTFGELRNGVVEIYNPKDSGVNIFINNAIFTNLSDSNISMDVFSFSNTSGNVNKSFNIVPGNLGNICIRKPKARLYYGIGVDVENGVEMLIYTIPKFSNLEVSPEGSVVLPPGANRVYIFNTINYKDTATVSVSFKWWEEEICTQNK